MKLQEQIKIVKELLEATKEINGEYQEGWNEDIEDGERLLEYLHSELKNKYWEKPKKIELDLESMASGEMIGNIKGLK
jgi:hypothetical protein